MTKIPARAKFQPETQRMNASKKRNRLIVLFRDTQIISARVNISARVDYKYSSD